MINKNLNNKNKNKKFTIKPSVIRANLRARYQPLIIKSLKPLQYIRQRSKRIAHNEQIDPQQKFKKLYSLISNKYLLIQALGNISSNKGADTPGVDDKTMDAMNLRRIEKLSNSLKDGTFKFSPFRRKMIPKPAKKGQPSKMRPLGIPNFDDRIVQEAIRLVLDSIYEPVFECHNFNYGFRPGKSCHDAIEKLKKVGTACDYAIEGDIKGAFDNVNHEVMFRILEKRIGDSKFLKLIKQGFTCGLLDQGKYKDTLLGVPQGGIASPLFFNIYMHEFDMFIHNELQNIIENKNNIEKRTSHGANNGLYLAIQQRINRNNKNLENILNKTSDYNLLPYADKERVKVLHKKLHKDYSLRSKTPSVLMNKRSIRIIYVRYADDWIILTNSNRSYCNEIKNLIKDKLFNDLKLELSSEKTKITNLKEDKAKFLGFSIGTYRTTNLTIRSGRLVRTAGYSIIVGIDMDRIINRLTIKGFCRDKSGNRPIAKPSYSVLTIQNIITTYNYIIRGVANYYLPMLSRVKDLIRVIYILEYSAYMTIAKKYGSKISKIREKYGKPLKVTVTQTETVKDKPSRTTVKQFTLLDYLTVKQLVLDSLKDSKVKHKEKVIVNSDIFNPMYKINWRTLRNLNSACCICGTTENVELHHVHKIRKEKVTGFAQVLKQINRKTIPLCKEHHLAAEQGKLDNIKVADLYFLDEFLA